MSKIEWDETWNPVTGCTKVSPGCAHCYMYAMYPRLKAMGNPGYQASPDVVTLRPEMIERPLRWRKPRMVFVNSMSDLFHEEIPEDFLDHVFAVMALTPRHTYQILTKRPERMREYLADSMRAELVQQFIDRYEDEFTEEGGYGPWPLRNVWLGVSVEDQRRADERIPILLDTPAAVRFLSCEPLLGPIELRQSDYLVGWDTPTIDWVIAGGESGPGARFVRPSDRHTCPAPSEDGDQVCWVCVSYPSHQAPVMPWLRSLRDQCAAAGTPYFLKQIGGYPDKRGGDQAVLDGRLHREMP